MKNVFRTIIFLIISLLFIACGQTVPTIPSPIPSLTATFTPTPNPTATATVEPTSRPEFVPPTLIPTIDPALVPELLSKAFSVQTLEGENGHKIQQITGWDYGFGGGLWWGSCSGYDWLDSSHLILYPATGQVDAPEGVWSAINVVPQVVVLNLESGHVWLPPEIPSSAPRSCNRVYWSSELEILIISEVHDEISTVSTYTYDGKKLSSYTGSIMDVSPRGTKILLEDNTVIDLQTNKRITLDWSMEDYQEEMLSDLFWTSDETRIYRCCYFYADLATGTSYRFEQSDFRDTDGNPLDRRLLWFYRGQWVRNDTYFMVEWSWIDDGDIRYLPLFDPATKIFYDVREMAGISPDWTSWETSVSLDGSYLWMTGWEGSHLINLSTFEARYFPDLSYAEVDWSLNSKFVWVQVSDQTNDSTRVQVLSVADKELRSVPVNPVPNSIHWWHPTDDIVAYPSADKNALIFLDASTMSYRELPFTLQKPPHDSHSDVVWSPNGEKLALVAEDGSVWQIDYSTLGNLEQLTLSLSNVSGLHWSPDGNSVSFISGADIYIVETTSK